MPALLKNEIGNEYGKLTVIKRAPNKGGKTRWICKCSCGSGIKKDISANALRTGRTISCGCERRGKQPSSYTPPKILAQRRAWYETVRYL